MKIAVMNLSGNVGKSTVAKHMLLPRVAGAAYVTVETINADEGGGEKYRGKEFGTLVNELMMVENAIVDVGASNIEELLYRMKQYDGSHEDFDLFVIPTTREAKQGRDTVNTIISLLTLGVPGEKIRVVFNRVEAGEDLQRTFATIFEFSEGGFRAREDVFVQESELYPMLGRGNVSIEDLLDDATDWKAKLKEAKSAEEKAECAQRISMRRLAASAQRNLETAFAAMVA